MKFIILHFIYAHLVVVEKSLRFSLTKFIFVVCYLFLFGLIFYFYFYFAYFMQFKKVELCLGFKGFI